MNHTELHRWFFPNLLLPRKKISRYVGDISCIKGYQYDISWININSVKFREKSPKIDDISQYIGDFSRYIIWLTQVNEVKHTIVKSMRYSDPTVPRKRPFLFLLRGFEPQTKRFKVQPTYRLGKLILVI